MLAGLSATAPLATDMYIPGLPDIGGSLGAEPWQLQLTIAGFLIGVVGGQFVLGPVSDRVGRRVVLLAGSTGFAVCSLACAAAPTVELLTVARFLQGVTGAAGLVVARAVVTDLHDDRASAKAFATLGAITCAAPIVAPLLGGAVLAVAPWRVVFVVLAALGALLSLGVLVWVPESLPGERRTRGGFLPAFAAVGQLARDTRLAGLVIALAFGNAAVFAYIAGTSFVFSGLFGLSSSATSLVFGVNALGNLLGTVAFGRLVDRTGPRAPLLGGLAAAAAGTLVLSVASLLGGAGFVVTWACLFVSITAFGLFFPAVTTAAQNRGRRAPGATSALLGSSQFLVGVGAAPLVGVFGTATAAPMAVIMTLCLAVALLAARVLGTARPVRVTGEVPRPTG